jgi:dCMP deaminase
MAVMNPISRRVPGWHAYYLAVCRSVALRSKDPDTQIGCIIVGPAHEIRSTGYNSFPRGIRDSVPQRLSRPEKYLWVEHAERNAIYNAARAGTPLQDCTIYVELMPCMDCARAIVQAGIVEVVVDANRMHLYSSKRYDPEFKKVKVLFKEADIKMQVVSVEFSAKKGPMKHSSD